MKETSIRVRMSALEKSQLMEHARRTRSSASRIVRNAVADAVKGSIPGEQQRLADFRMRRSANELLQIMGAKPIDALRLRTALSRVHAAATSVLSCR